MSLSAKLLLVLSLTIATSSGSPFHYLKDASGFIWPKDSVEDYNEELKLSSLSSSSSSYIPKRFRRQDDADEGMIVIPGVAQLLPKFDELVNNQSVLLANQQTSLAALLNGSITILRQDFDDSLNSSKSQLDNSTSMLEKLLINSTQRINDDLNSATQSIKEESAANLKSAMDESAVNLKSAMDESAKNLKSAMQSVKDTLDNSTQDTVVELKLLFDQSLRDATMDIKQMMFEILNIVKQHYDHATHHSDAILHSFRQNTYDEFTDVKSQLSVLEKITRTMALQQQQQYMRFAFEGAYPMMPPIPYYPVAGGYYPAQPPVYPMMPHPAVDNNTSASHALPLLPTTTIESIPPATTLMFNETLTTKPT